MSNKTQNGPERYIVGTDIAFGPDSSVQLIYSPASGTFINTDPFHELWAEAAGHFRQPWVEMGTDDDNA